MKIARLARTTANAAGSTGRWLTVVLLASPVFACSLLDKGLEATAPDKI